MILDLEQASSAGLMVPDCYHSIVEVASLQSDSLIFFCDSTRKGSMVSSCKFNLLLDIVKIVLISDNIIA